MQNFHTFKYYFYVRINTAEPEAWIKSIKKGFLMQQIKKKE